MLRAVVLFALIASPAFAQEKDIPLVESKLHPMQYRFELSGFWHQSFNDKYLEHFGVSGALAFHLRDDVALEAFAGYLVGDETGVVGRLRTEERQRVDCAERCDTQLPDLWQTTWFTGGDIQWSPLYGKLSIVSEAELSFQAYAIVGGGAEGITRLLDDTTYAQPLIRVSANYGLGVRLMPWKHVAIRAELRNYNGWNPNVVENDPDEEARCSDGYTLNVGNEERCYVDISNNTMMQVGVSLVF